MTIGPDLLTPAECADIARLLGEWADDRDYHAEQYTLAQPEIAAELAAQAVRARELIVRLLHVPYTPREIHMTARTDLDPLTYAIAVALHGNKSMHVHEHVGNPAPCRYCIYDATIAASVVNEHALKKAYQASSDTATQAARAVAEAQQDYSDARRAVASVEQPKS